MVLKKTVLSSLVVLVALCLTAKGIYKLLYYGNLDLKISKRSLERNNKTAPITVNFPRNYHATGRLFLPHSNIVEPFEIWFTSDYNRSRIDYYYGILVILGIIKFQFRLKTLLILQLDWFAEHNETKL